MHLQDKATLQSTASALHCHGMEFRGTTRRRLLQCHMEFDWQELKQHSYDNKPVLKRILLLAKPFGMGRIELDPANPTLFNIALTPEDTSDFLSEEFFAQKLASFASPWTRVGYAPHRSRASRREANRCSSVPSISANSSGRVARCQYVPSDQRPSPSLAEPG